MHDHLKHAILQLSEPQRKALYQKIGTRAGAAACAQHSGQVLTAWIVPMESGVDVSELKAFLADLVPDHMVPGNFVVLPELPLTPGGKVDRKALLNDDVGARTEYGASALHTPMETLLGRIWCEVLGIKRVGRHDNFFDLGGHSLLALRLIAKVSKAVRQNLSVKFLFVNPTIHLQAMELEHNSTSSPPTDNTSSEEPVDTRAESLLLKARPNVSRVLDVEIGAVDAVALGYLSSDMAKAMGWSVDGMISSWFVSGVPVIDGLIETPWGRIGGISLPYSESTLYEDSEGLLTNIVVALKMARRFGAKVVTMTGLIPSATNSGKAVVKRVEAEGISDLPVLSTGHATTSAAVVLNIGRILHAVGRDLAAERVAFVGLGSIGLSVLRLMLRCMPHPREIILCDLYARSSRLREIRDELTTIHQFRGSVQLASARREIPAEVYRASLIVGATNVPDVLDVKSVIPGTIIVDDSAPHCFSTAAAIARFEKNADVAFVEGGVLGLREPISEIAYFPQEIVTPTNLSRFAEFLEHDPLSITGCVFSGLLSATFGFPPTIGTFAVEEGIKHYLGLRRLGFTGGRLQCDSHVLRKETLQRFRDAFGGN